jgi:sirohydrochlorin cobaltochelatase
MVTTEKQAILLVAFGTTLQRAAEAFSRFESATKVRFPDIEIRWAYTSAIVRRKLAERGEAKDSVGDAIERLAYDGYRTIAVQSLHTIAGAEYHKMLREISVFRHKSIAQNIVVKVGSPLLAGYEDAQRVAQKLIQEAVPERNSSDALIFMGHGSERHASDLAYVALASMLNNTDKRAWLGTVEGHPTLADVVAQCKAADIRKAWLVPFMAVAGDHALNDMAGDEEDSWVSVLTKEGISCTPVFKGTLDIAGIAGLWLDHLETAILQNDRSQIFNDQRKQILR